MGGDQKTAEVDLQKVRRSLVASKAWMTRCRVKLEGLVDDISPDSLALEDTLQEAETRLSHFDRMQSQLEMRVEENTLDSCIAEAGDFRDSFIGVRLRAQKIHLASLARQGPVSSTASSRLNVKLPQLQLPKFDGSVTAWQPFWDKFSALIDNTDLPEVTKFSYLTSVLEGEASHVIQGLAVTESNYSIACDLLKERFG